jgi:hypothetical protein
MFTKLAAAFVALALAGSAAAFAASLDDHLPYTNGLGDPAGLTLTPAVDDFVTGSIGGKLSYLPYTNGAGDPDGLTLTVVTDDLTTGSIAGRLTYLPYTNGMGDPDGLTLTN